MNFLTDVLILKGMQHPFQNRAGASSCSCIPGAVPRKCSCSKLRMHPMCSCSSSPKEVKLLQTAAAAAAAFLHTSMELQIKLQPAVPKMQLQLLSPPAQKCIANCSCSCPKELQPAVTNCSCSCPKELQLLQTAVAAKLQPPRPFPHQD